MKSASGSRRRSCGSVSLISAARSVIPGQTMTAMTPKSPTNLKTLTTPTTENRSTNSLHPAMDDIPGRSVHTSSSLAFPFSAEESHLVTAVRYAARPAAPAPSASDGPFETASPAAPYRLVSAGRFATVSLAVSCRCAPDALFAKAPFLWKV